MRATLSSMQTAYLTISEVATELDISADGVYKLIKRGKLPAIRRSERGLRVSRVALDAYQRRVRGDSTPIPEIRLIDTGIEELRTRFEHETGLSPHEWERRWKAEEIEDSSENMQLAIRALGLLIAERKGQRLETASTQTRG
jgi:excisionase family DNA binding protein